MSWILDLAGDAIGKILEMFEKIGDFHCPGKEIKEADFQRLISEMAFCQAHGDDQFVFYIVPGHVQVYKLFNANWNVLSDGMLQQIYQFEWAFGNNQYFIEHVERCRKEFYRHYDEEDTEIVIRLAHGVCTVFSVKDPKRSFQQALDQALGQRILQNINHFTLAKSCWTCRKFKRFVKKIYGFAGKFARAIQFLLSLISKLTWITSPFKWIASIFSSVKSTAWDVLKWIFSAGKALAEWIGNKFLEYAFRILHGFCESWKSAAQQILEILFGFWGETVANSLGSFFAKIGAWLGGLFGGSDGELPGGHIGEFVGPFLFTFISDKMASLMAKEVCEEVFEEWKEEEEEEEEAGEEDEEEAEEKQEEEEANEPDEDFGGGIFGNFIAAMADMIGTGLKWLAEGVCYALLLIGIVLILTLLLFQLP